MRTRRREQQWWGAHNKLVPLVTQWSPKLERGYAEFPCILLKSTGAPAKMQILHLSY